MSTRLVCVAFRAERPHALAEFWSRLLGWPVVVDRPDRVGVAAPDPGFPGPALTFRPAPPGVPAHDRPNRLHLDLASFSAAQQAARVRRALELGARPLDLGQGDTPWVVLADPEGNEFCVLEPRPEYQGTGAVAAVVVRGAEPDRLARFWSAVSGRPVLRDDGVAGLRSPTELGSWLEFVPGADAGDDRLHLDLAARQRAAAAERLRAAGAAPLAAPGPCGGPVFADPEHHRFCLLESP